MWLVGDAANQTENRTNDTDRPPAPAPLSSNDTFCGPASWVGFPPDEGLLMKNVRRQERSERESQAREFCWCRWGGAVYRPACSRRRDHLPTSRSLMPSFGTGSGDPTALAWYCSRTSSELGSISERQRMRGCDTQIGETEGSVPCCGAAHDERERTARDAGASGRDRSPLGRIAHGRPPTPGEEQR